MMQRFCLMLSCLLVLPACGTGSGDDGGSFTDAGTSSGGGTDSGYVDGVPCDAQGCSVDADCCLGHLAVNHFGSALACPGDRFPNRWDCQSGECVNLGCTNDTDCGQDLYECHQVNGVGHCLRPCTSNSQCENEFNMNHTECEGLAANGKKYCIEPPP